MQDVSRSAGILESLPRDSWASSTRRDLDGDLVDAPGLVVPEFVQRRDLRELRFDSDDAEYLSTFFLAESWFMGSVKSSLFSAITTVTMRLYVARRLR